MRKGGYMIKLLLTVAILLAGNVDFAHSQLSVVFDGDTVEVWDSRIDWPCAAVFFPVTRISQDTIYITEMDTMNLATCSCTYSVCTKLTDLDAGKHTAVVARQWQFHQRFPVDTIIGFTESVGSIDFTVVKASTKQYQVSFYQSGCNPDAVDEASTIPNKFLLVTNYPNPFNPNTIIRYMIPVKSHVLLSIHNLAGQHIVTLVDGQKPAGVYDINYSATHLSSGIYICRLIVGGSAISSKMILIK